MENRIREYEKFIKKSSKNPTPALREQYREILRNFQHERLIHLLVTLGFVLFTLILIILDTIIWVNFELESFWDIWPLHAAIALLFIVDIFYVKHYYFLENHIQRLYDIDLRGGGES